jgi:hypothetical protein
MGSVTGRVGSDEIALQRNQESAEGIVFNAVESVSGGFTNGWTLSGILGLAQKPFKEGDPLPFVQ